MGYLHISNLYRDQRILLFKEVWALEKVHGTSAHVRWQDGRIHLASGGEKAERFARLFDIEDGTRRFTELGHASVVVYGEAYGGSQQKQAWRYGPELRFVAFDVMIGGADTRTVISAMLEDVLREAAGEIVDSKDARGAISKRAAVLFHAKLRGASA